jgi:hypothetical protein
MDAHTEPALPDTSEASSSKPQQLGPFNFVKDWTTKTITSWDELETFLKEQEPSIRNYPLYPLQKAIRAFELYCSKVLEKPEWSFYTDLLPKIVEWATETTYKIDLPLFLAQQQTKFTLSSYQARWILSNSFLLNILCASDISIHLCRFGTISHSELFALDAQLSLQRLLCILAYFEQARDLELYNITYERWVLGEADVPSWSKMADRVPDYDSVNLHVASMETSVARGFVDFANECIHIGRVTPFSTANFF